MRKPVEKFFKGGQIPPPMADKFPPFFAYGGQIKMFLYTNKGQFLFDKSFIFVIIFQIYFIFWLKLWKNMKLWKQKPPKN